MFGASHLIRGVSDFSLPESDPNDSEPAADRVFRSPAEKTPVSAILWFELADGASSAAVELWVRTDRSWRRAGSASVNEPGISADVSLPSDADLFVRVLAAIASKDAILAAGFRPAPSLNATSLVAGGLLVTAPPLVGDPGFPAYLINPVVVSSLGGVSAVSAGLGPFDSGLPIRTIEEAGRIPVILGLGGEGGDQPLGTVLAPLFVRGSDGTDTQQLALDRTRADEAAAVKLALADGSDFYDAARAAQLPAVLVGGRLDANVGAWLGSTAPTVGQKTGAASVPVVLASDVGLPAGANPIGHVDGLGTQGSPVGGVVTVQGAATAEPATSSSTPGAVVRPLTEPWLVATSGAALLFLVKDSKALLVRIRALNTHATALFLTLHNAASTGAAAEGNRVGLPRAVPSAPGPTAGERSEDFDPIEFSAGLVMAVSTSATTYVAAGAGSELYFSAHYR